MATDDLDADLAVLRHVAERNQVDPADLALAESIARAENDRNFGVRSVQVADQQQAARVLFNSIKNGRARWESDGKPGDLVTYMNESHHGYIWAEDPNWRNNVRAILKRDAPAPVYEQAKQRFNLP